MSRVSVCNFFLLLSACVICFIKMFYFEVSVGLPLWDSLCTSQKTFFLQLVLQLCAESLVMFQVTIGFLFNTRRQQKQKRRDAQHALSHPLG